MGDFIDKVARRYAAKRAAAAGINLSDLPDARRGRSGGADASVPAELPGDSVNKLEGAGGDGRKVSLPDFPDADPVSTEQTGEAAPPPPEQMQPELPPAPPPPAPPPPAPPPAPPPGQPQMQPPPPPAQAQPQPQMQPAPQPGQPQMQPPPPVPPQAPVKQAFFPVPHGFDGPLPFGHAYRVLPPPLHVSPPYAPYGGYGRHGLWSPVTPAVLGTPRQSEDSLADNFERQKDLILNLAGQVNPNTGKPFKLADVDRMINSLNATTSRAVNAMKRTKHVYGESPGLAKESSLVGRLAVAGVEKRAYGPAYAGMYQPDPQALTPQPGRNPYGPPQGAFNYVSSLNPAFGVRPGVTPGLYSPYNAYAGMYPMGTSYYGRPVGIGRPYTPFLPYRYGGMGFGGPGFGYGTGGYGHSPAAGLAAMSMMPSLLGTGAFGNAHTGMPGLGSSASATGKGSEELMAQLMDHQRQIYANQRALDNPGGVTQADYQTNVERLRRLARQIAGGQSVAGQFPDPLTGEPMQFGKSLSFGLLGDYAWSTDKWKDFETLYADVQRQKSLLARQRQTADVPYQETVRARTGQLQDMLARQQQTEAENRRMAREHYAQVRATELARQQSAMRLQLMQLGVPADQINSIFQPKTVLPPVAPTAAPAAPASPTAAPPVAPVEPPVAQAAPPAAPATPPAVPGAPPAGKEPKASHRGGDGVLDRLAGMTASATTRPASSCIDKAAAVSPLGAALARALASTAAGTVIGGTVGGLTAPSDYALEGALRGARIGTVGGLGFGAGSEAGRLAGRGYVGLNRLVSNSRSLVDPLVAPGLALAGGTAGGVGAALRRRKVEGDLPWEAGEPPMMEQIGDAMQRRPMPPRFTGRPVRPPGDLRSPLPGVDLFKSY